MTKEEIAKSKGLTITKNAPPSKRTKYFEKHSQNNSNQPENCIKNVKTYEKVVQHPNLEEIKEKISSKYPKLKKTKIFDIVNDNNSQQEQNKPNNPYDPPNINPSQPTDPPNTNEPQEPTNPPSVGEPQEPPSNPPSGGDNNNPQEPNPSEPPINNSEEKRKKIWRKNDKAIKEKKYEEVEIFETSLRDELYTEHAPITKKYMDENFLDKKFDIWIDDIEGSNLITKKYELTFKVIMYMSLFYRNEFNTFKLSPKYSKEEVTECYRLFGFTLIYFDSINTKKHNSSSSNKQKRVLITKFRKNHKDRITETNMWPGVDLRRI